MKNLNKGTAEDVRGANLDCLLYKSNAAVSKSVIAQRPHVPVQQLPHPMGFTSVEVVKFSLISMHQTS
jgi:hypothetical protein